jgi:hypothetical protein
MVANYFDFAQSYYLHNWIEILFVMDIEAEELSIPLKKGYEAWEDNFVEECSFFGVWTEGDGEVYKLV